MIAGCVGLNCGHNVQRAEWRIAAIAVFGGSDNAVIELDLGLQVVIPREVAARAFRLVFA